MKNWKELVKERQQEIEQLLNEIALVEFEYNYNLSEYARIVNYEKIKQDERVQLFISKIEEILKPMFKDMPNMEYDISEMGMLDIYEIEKQTEIMKQCKSQLRIFHTLETPYAYVMGKACGKRNGAKYLEDLKYSFKRYAI